MNDRSERLARLGDRMEAAVDRDGRAGAARGRRAVVGLVASAVVVVGLGALAGTSGSSPPPEEIEVRSEPDQVEGPGPSTPTDPTPTTDPSPSSDPTRSTSPSPDDPSSSTGPSSAEARTSAAVAQGMVDGALVFAGTYPSCTADGGVEVTCTLRHLPTAERIADHTGVLQTYVDDQHRIAGACRGQDQEGRTWSCLAGEAAVEAGYIAVDLLGQSQPVPGRG